MIFYDFLRFCYFININSDNLYNFYSENSNPSDSPERKALTICKVAESTVKFAFCNKFFFKSNLRELSKLIAQLKLKLLIELNPPASSHLGDFAFRAPHS